MVKRIAVIVSFVLIFLTSLSLVAFLVIKHVAPTPGGQPADNFTETLHQLTDACPAAPLFTRAPIEPADLLAITPLGNFNPPDHTIPTDHMYFVLKNHTEIEPSAARRVIAPSDLTITRMSQSTAEYANGLESNDYSLDFSVCGAVQGKFGHVTRLAPAIQALVANKKPTCHTSHPRPDDSYVYCNYELRENITAGTELGEAGGGTATGLDVWLTDTRPKPLVFANPDRYRNDQLAVACPIEYFADTIRATLSAKLGDGLQQRTEEPICGTINYDLPGTLQGNWLAGDGLIDQPENWSKSLTFGFDNIDPSISVISIGGLISQPGVLVFASQDTGTTNRRFADVTADGKIYCYETTARRHQGRTDFTGQRLLVQLTSPAAMQTEVQAGSCQTPRAFTKATTYQR